MKYKAGNRRRASEYEKALVEWWKKNKTFEKSVEQRPIDNSYVFYDGPPFITGMPHHGTLLSSIVKDAVPRYWTMRGKRVERRWGWDCHGLPAENFVEKQLGITDRREIGTKWSLEDYILKARESMVANSETWEGTIDRIGRWVDFKGAYRTMDKDFMESVWWAFKQLYEAGKIYEGRKVLMYDTKFATPVSKSEVTMDNDAYQTVTDPSAYVKFKLTDESAKKLERKLDDDAPEFEHGRMPIGKNVYFLAWTTTPWTLPANMALAVNPKMTYLLLGREGVDELLIVAEGRAKAVFESEEDWKDYADFEGTELIGLTYEPLCGSGPLFDGKGVQPPKASSFAKSEVNSDFAKKKDTWTVLGADFVSDADGTGIVHIAPAYGEDDYKLAQEHDVDFVDVLDEYGYYTEPVKSWLHELGVRDTDERGIEIWAGNKFIAKCLEEKGIVWKIEYIKHEYPFNPRSKQRIMYRAFPSWFFDVQGSKALMLAQNENINWFPGYLKHGRFAKNIEQAPDWNLSRDRFWATAMPVWKGSKGSVKVVGSYAELKELSGVELEDYHRPWVDEIEFDVDGEHFKRIDKVLDCWFESGSMPFAQLHYPFENKEKFERNYPADFIVEYVGQVRAWFYYVHCVNTALASIGAFGQDVAFSEELSQVTTENAGRAAPATAGGRDDRSEGNATLDRKLNAFKNVITTGTLAGNDGRKMSKSLGNYTDPNVLMDQYSADALRFLLLSSPVLSGEDFALTDKDVSDVNRKLAMIWNVYDFFTTYAEVDEWTIPDAFSKRKAMQDFSGEENKNLTPLCANGNDARGTGEASGIDERGHWRGELKNPLDIWIIARLRQLKGEVIAGMGEYNIPRALSGVLPFVDDLSNWFVRRSRRRFWKSEDDADKAEAYWTLWRVLSRLAKILAPFTPFLAEELWQNMVGNWNPENSVHLQEFPMCIELDNRMEEVLKQMAQVRAVINEGLKLRMYKDEHEQQVKVRQPLAKLVYVGEVLPEWGVEIVKDEVNVKAVERGQKAWIDKEITEELGREGLARELVRVVQGARKKAGLQVDDRIRLSVGTAIPSEWVEMVKQETLTDELAENGNFAYDEIVKLQGENVTISLEKI